MPSGKCYSDKSKKVDADLRKIRQKAKSLGMTLVSGEDNHVPDDFYIMPRFSGHKRGKSTL